MLPRVLLPSPSVPEPETRWLPERKKCSRFILTWNGWPSTGGWITVLECTSVVFIDHVIVLALCPGDVIVLALCPGDVIVLALYPGDVIALALYPGDVIVLALCPGDVIALALYPGDVVVLAFYPGDVIVLVLYPDAVQGSSITELAEYISLVPRPPPF